MGRESLLASAAPIEVLYPHPKKFIFEVNLLVWQVY